MSIREALELREKESLSDLAKLSIDTLGRRFEEDKCSMRTDFQRDRDRIIHSKAFRRLKHKTQVFISPEGDHFRTRLTHTLEVGQIARTIGRALGLNEDLVEAIALGHDLGHTPFGHTGENLLNKVRAPKAFKHNEQSLRIVDILESKTNRKGLNLTYEVRDGILNHTGGKIPITAEGQVVRLADRIAYINHDIDDSIRAGIISEEELPRGVLEVLGKSHSERINNMIEDIVFKSLDAGEIKMSPEFSMATNDLRNFMFNHVYLNSKAKGQEAKAEYVLKKLYDYYLEKEALPKSHVAIYSKEDFEDYGDMVCDYIAGMTDRFAINKFSELFIPESWSRY